MSYSLGTGSKSTQSYKGCKAHENVRELSSLPSIVDMPQWVDWGPALTFAAAAEPAELLRVLHAVVDAAAAAGALAVRRQNAHVVTELATLRRAEAVSSAAEESGEVSSSGQGRAMGGGVVY